MENNTERCQSDTKRVIVMSRQRIFTTKQATELILASNTSSGSEFECTDISDDSGMLPAMSTPGPRPSADHTWEWYDDMDDYSTVASSIYTPP